MRLPGEAVAFLADALRQLAARRTARQRGAAGALFGAQADLYYDGLLRAEVPNVRRVRELDFTWEPGFDITDVRQTKGLEFDEVVLLETSASSYPDNAAVAPYAVRRCDPRRASTVVPDDRDPRRAGDDGRPRRVDRDAVMTMLLNVLAALAYAVGGAFMKRSDGFTDAGASVALYVCFAVRRDVCRRWR